MDTATLQRPLPLLPTNLSFSQRKKTPLRTPCPPKPTIKSCPPVSRIYRSPNSFNRPYAVSFKPEREENTIVLQSPFYDVTLRQLYFEQCFVIKEKLGAGAFGEVYKVESKEDGKMYAVKRSKQGFRGEWDRRNTLAEVEKHEKLPPHPNCVYFVKAWEERGHLYIQTELCKMSLSEYADLHGRIAESLIWSFLLDLTKGIKHLHDHHLCHFDIKPANIFIAEDVVTCKLGDFGLVVSEEQIGSADIQEGDPKYMAPELMQGHFGKPADIFSLGISLLELACEMELPGGGHTWHQLRSGYLPEEFTHHLSSDLLDIFKWMMHPQPQLRPTADQILNHPTVFNMPVQKKYHPYYHKTVAFMAHCCSTMWGGILKLIMLIASIIPYGDHTIPTRTTEHYITSSPPTAYERREALRSAHKLLSPPALTFSDIDEELTESSSDETHKHDKSWLNDSPVRFRPPMYNGPPMPLQLDFGDVDDHNSSFDSHLNTSLESSPSLKLSPARHDTDTLKFTPASGPGNDEAYTLKPGVIGPRNLMSVFAEAANNKN